MKNEIMRLNDVCEFIVDCLHKTAPTQAEGIPLIRTPNIGKGRLILEDVYKVSDDTYKIWTKRAIPEPNDLIMAREAPAGNVAIIKDGQTVCLGQRTVHIRPDQTKINPAFLCYFLLAPKQQGRLFAYETGATSKHINMRDIRNLSLLGIPSKSEQKRIADILSAYDDLIENNRRRVALLEQAARLLYKEWFVHLRFPGHERVKIVDGVPEGWEKKALGKIGKLNYGKSLKADNRIPGPFPVFGSSGIVGSHQKSLVKGPGIIVGRKGNVGSVFWSDEDFYPIDTVYFIESSASSFFLYYALKQTQFINTDVAVPGLNRDLAHSREILFPENRLRILFEESISPFHNQIKILNKYNEELAKARDLLLPRLMNGEVKV
ncbi:MAG: restriction endonuclease subunit S [Desulfococcaceae bacterium]|jgi:type I restriction enzyme S subunit|nr:restriction endonuclease subunit S [Desulfococcaceae bacterium]